MLGLIFIRMISFLTDWFHDECGPRCGREKQPEPSGVVRPRINPSETSDLTGVSLDKAGSIHPAKPGRNHRAGLGYAAIKRWPATQCQHENVANFAIIFG